MAKNFNSALAALTDLATSQLNAADDSLIAARSWLAAQVEGVRQQFAEYAPPAKRQRVTRGRSKSKQVSDGKENEPSGQLPPLPPTKTGPARRTRRALALATVAEEEPEPASETPAAAAAPSDDERATEEPAADESVAAAPSAVPPQDAPDAETQPTKPPPAKRRHAKGHKGAPSVAATDATEQVASPACVPATDAAAPVRRTSRRTKKAAAAQGDDSQPEAYASAAAETPAPAMAETPAAAPATRQTRSRSRHTAATAETPAAAETPPPSPPRTRTCSKSCKPAATPAAATLDAVAAVVLATSAADCTHVSATPAAIPLHAASQAVTGKAAAACAQPAAAPRSSSRLARQTTHATPSLLAAAAAGKPTPASVDARASSTQHDSDVPAAAGMAIVVTAGATEVEHAQPEMAASPEAPNLQNREPAAATQADASPAVQTSSSGADQSPASAANASDTPSASAKAGDTLHISQHSPSGAAETIRLPMQNSHPLVSAKASSASSHAAASAPAAAATVLLQQQSTATPVSQTYPAAGPKEALQLKQEVFTVPATNDTPQAPGARSTKALSGAAAAAAAETVQPSASPTEQHMSDLQPSSAVQPKQPSDISSLPRGSDAQPAVELLQHSSMPAEPDRPAAAECPVSVGHESAYPSQPEQCARSPATADAEPADEPAMAPTAAKPPIPALAAAAAALQDAATIPLPNSVPRPSKVSGGSSSGSDGAAEQPPPRAASHLNPDREQPGMQGNLVSGFTSNVMSGVRSFLGPRPAAPSLHVKPAVKLPALEAAAKAKAKEAAAATARQAKVDEIARRKEARAKAQEEAAARAQAAEKARLDQGQREAEEKRRRAEQRRQREEEIRKKAAEAQDKERKRKAEAAKAQAAEAKRPRQEQQPAPLLPRQPLAARPANVLTSANTHPANQMQRSLLGPGGQNKATAPAPPSKPQTKAVTAPQAAAQLATSASAKQTVAAVVQTAAATPQQVTVAAAVSASAPVTDAAPASGSAKGMLAAAANFVMGAVRATPPAVAATAGKGPQSYEISPYRSDCDSEEEEDDNAARKPVPDWARGVALREALLRQLTIDPDEIFQQNKKTCSLNEVFGHADPIRARGRDFSRRTSSGNWIEDRVTAKEQIMYKKAMGYL